MPLTKCSVDGRPGWKWGDSSRAQCYSFTEGDPKSEGLAKRKAYQQGAAAGQLSKADALGLADLLEDEAVAKAGEHSMEYLAAVAKLARKYLPDWLWSQIHRAAMPSSGGRARWRPMPDVAKAEQHSGAMVALYPDPDTAEQLAVPGGEEPGDLHVTLAFLGPADQVDQESLVNAVREYCDEWMGGGAMAPDIGDGAAAKAQRGGPLEGRVGGHGVFYAQPSSDGSDVLYAHPDVPGLAEFRHGLVQKMEAAGCGPKSEHGFSPHMTLAYAEPAQKDQPDVGDVHVAGPDWRRRRARKDEDIAGTDGPQLGVYGALPQLPLRFHQVAVVHGGDRADVPFAEPPAAKAEPEDDVVKLEVEIVKADAERHLVYGVVVAPDQVDSQDDVMSAEDIERSAHQFLIDHITHQEDWGGSPINLQHGPDVDAVPVESYIAPADMEFEAPDGRKRTIKQGSWIMVGYVPGDETWAMVQNGEITGWSLEGYGRREELGDEAA